MNRVGVRFDAICEPRPNIFCAGGADWSTVVTELEVCGRSELPELALLSWEHAAINES